MTLKRKLVSPSRARAALFLLAALCASSPAPAAPVSTPHARPDEPRFTVEFYPPGGDAEKTNPVLLSFVGKLYDNLPLPESGEDAKLASDEKFIAKVIAVNRRGTPDELLLLWEAAERERVKKLVSDPQIFAANRKAYSAVGKSYLHAKINYGTYVIFIVRHTDSVNRDTFKDYPIKKSDSGYHLTNALSADPVFQYLTTKYVKKLGGR